MKLLYIVNNVVEFKESRLKLKTAYVNPLAEIDTTIKSHVHSIREKYPLSRTRMYFHPNFAETEISSLWWNFYHLLHQKLSKWLRLIVSKWQLRPVTTNFIKWGYFRFTVSHAMLCHTITELDCYTSISSHYCDVIRARWCLKSPASRLFTNRLFRHRS